MATLKQKIDAERTMRELLEREGIPQPDHIEYGYTCIRLFWSYSKVVVVVDIDEPPPDLGEADEASYAGDDNGWQELVRRTAEGSELP
ncbi:MAG: hypothetical protein JO206_06745 [Solirubrobacterales bacterium]|nr:hypothetical protein [Solirubrobacterales bacterium]MBV9472650.1 hypothetical protein [Solirubrobacterales bacterium]MBV9839027.1 hypothetical protein [Solirubrobacterales bacterium]